jgi:hypothetical protein
MCYTVLRATDRVETEMKTNITLRMDAQLVREAKILAARRGTSVSGMLAKQLEELVRSDKAYEDARKRAVRRIRKGFDLGWKPVKDRQELHER